MNTQKLVLHCGGNEATLAEIDQVATPRNTDTHYPIPHTRLIDSVKTSLSDGGYRILGEQHALNKDGNNYFGIIQIANGGGNADDYGWVVGLRNSHIKDYVAGLVAGSRVFVCDNLAFSGEIKVARKHTRFILRDLEGLVQGSVGRLNDALGLLDQRIDAYKGANIGDRDAHHLLIKAVDARAIVPQDIVPVLQEWREPQHEEFAPRTAWSLFNAFTERHKRINQAGTLLNRGNSLHGVFDSFVGLKAN